VVVVIAGSDEGLNRRRGQDMSLKECRKIAKRVRRTGVACNIELNSKACVEHNPAIHPMCGHYVVVANMANGKEYVWSA